MKYKNYLTEEYIRSILSYDSKKGNLKWEETRGSIKAGRIAGSRHHTGYIDIKIDRKMYRAHRIAWLLMTGKWPKDQIDHRDGDRSNNKWDNLREADYNKNSHNQSMAKNNASGYKGVYLAKGYEKWVAQIRVNYKKIHLGYFGDKESAAKAYNEAALNYFKEFAKLNEIKNEN